MSLQTRAEFAQSETFLYRKISRMCHHRIEHRSDVTITQNQTVALRPFGVFGIVSQYAEVEGGKNIRHAQRARGVPRTRRNEHFYYGLANLVGLLFELRSEEHTSELQ